MTNILSPPSGAVAIAATRSPLLDKLGELCQIEPIVVLRTSDPVTRWLKTALPLRGATDANYRLAQQRLERLPDRATLSHQCAELRNAIYAAAAEPEVEALVALTFDGIPSASSRVTTTLIDATVFSLMHADDDRDASEYPHWNGLSAQIIAGATRRLWRESCFVPCPKEFVEKALGVRWRYFSALRATDQLLELRRNAEEAANVRIVGADVLTSEAQR
jgi:hypothetical protein